MPRKAEPGSAGERRQQFNIHATPELRERVRRAAEKSGRSIAKELEFRLDNSFARDEVIELLLGGSRNGRLVERIAAAIRDSGTWRTDTASIEKVVANVADLIRGDAEAANH